MSLFDLYRWIDRSIGGLLCRAIGATVRERTLPHPRRILALRLWGMGDAILTLPAIKALKERYPEAQIDVLCRRRNKAVYLNHPFIHRIREFEYAHYVPLLLLFRRYDLVVDFEQYLNLSALIAWWMGNHRVGFSHGIRSQIHTQRVDYNRHQHMLTNYNHLINTCGASCDQLIRLSSTKEVDAFVERFMETQGLHKEDLKIGVQVTVAESGKTRLWNNQKWADVCDYLIKKHQAKICFIGGPGAVPANEAVMQRMHYPAYNCANMSKRQAFAFISTMDLMISLDTGPMHVAAAQGVPTVGIFGPNTPVLWGPHGENNVSVYKKVSCSPCILNDKGRAPPCLRTHNRHLCMKQIMPQDVIDAVESLL